MKFQILMALVGPPASAMWKWETPAELSTGAAFCDGEPVCFAFSTGLKRRSRTEVKVKLFLVERFIEDHRPGSTRGRVR